jgi:hypothetical protein
MHQQSEAQLRRQARRAGLRVVRFGERSRWYWQYGPYALVDAETDGIVVYGLDADGLATELDKRR